MLTPPMMFDGDDEDYQPFADLLQKLQHSIQVDSTFSDVGLEDLIPICLYGTALRYFESLDSDCQSDASQLTVALETRFPRRSVPVVGAPAVVAACPPSSDAYGISTPAAIAPATVSSLASPTHQAPEIKPKSSASKIMGSLMDVTEKIRYVSIARPLMPPTEELSPQVEIPLFYIDHHSSSYPTIVKRVFELDPRDYKAVAETAKKRLFDLSQYEANRYDLLHESEA
ncbi:hypothetical protein FRB90_007914 [Tulasnella sp. 427]|nr:hypothetical protein FRB90_007914 [Tulasnella sp. 427]